MEVYKTWRCTIASLWYVLVIGEMLFDISMEDHTFLDVPGMEAVELGLLQDNQRNLCSLIK